MQSHEKIRLRQHGKGGCSPSTWSMFCQLKAAAQQLISQAAKAHGKDCFAELSVVCFVEVTRDDGCGFQIQYPVFQLVFLQYRIVR